MKEINIVRKLALNFREAIERAKASGEQNQFFLKFPQGCCGDASDLLAQYLIKHDISSVYVCGTYYGRTIEERQSHAWLKLNDELIVDITGDQFSNKEVFQYFNESVWCGPLSDFHRLFVINQECKETGLESLGKESQERLSNIYQIICKYL